PGITVAPGCSAGLQPGIPLLSEACRPQGAISPRDEPGLGASRASFIPNHNQVEEQYEGSVVFACRDVSLDFRPFRADSFRADRPAQRLCGSSLSGRTVAVLPDGAGTEREAPEFGPG